ncbi:MAG TPA: VacJ family lipoprotein [Pseudohongiella sp.]|nr:VacJ family lipoprotein [Pseudohongiella sp.]
MLGRDIGLRTRSLLAGLGLLVLPVVSQAQAPEYDPWEPVNLKIHAFNDKLDAAILRPVAESYSRYVPRIAQRGVSNFFSNLNDVTVLVNNILQLKIINAASDTGRIVLNTTLGIGGLIDVATPVGLQKNNEDFGQTLGRWGVRPGPYVVLPLLGPSTLRDSFGLVADTFTNPMTYHEEPSVRNSAWALNQLDRRVSALAADALIMGDPYIFIREAYLQQRQYLVSDGEVQDSWEDDEWDAWD